jgi:hypothetical protein
MSSSTDLAASTKPPQPAPSNDLLWGAQAIAEFLGVPIDRVYYLIRTKRVPFTKLGPKTILASKRQLRRALSINAD